MSTNQMHPILLIADGDEFSITDSEGVGWDVTAEPLEDGTYELCLNHEVGDGDVDEGRLMTGPMAPSESRLDVYAEFTARMPEWLSLAAKADMSIAESR